MASEHDRPLAEMPEHRRECRPFERFDYEKLPAPRADDPPYRPWWVVGDPQSH